MKQDNQPVIVAESERGIPTTTKIYQLFEREDGAVVANSPSKDVSALTPIDKSEVWTTSPVVTKRLLELEEFDPHKYRCTFTNLNVDTASDGYDYNIGFLSEKMLKRESIQVDQIIGVERWMSGSPQEVKQKLKESDLTASLRNYSQ